MDKGKAQRAAIAAVNQYLKEERESAGYPASGGYAPGFQARLNTWGLSGRQAQMQMRVMISMKALHGWKEK